MTITEFSAEWCLSTFRQIAGLPDEAPDPSETVMYDLVTNGCRRIQRLLAQHVPDAVKIAPEELTTLNDGVTYTFAYYPMGRAEVREGRTGRVLVPGPDWDNSSSTYVMEGQTIRWPNNQARTFPTGLWARYTPEHPVVDENTAPILTRIALRAAIWDAVAEWAAQGDAVDPTRYELGRAREMWGDKNMPGDEGVIGALKRQFYAQGAPAGGDAYWWRNSDWVQGPQ